ncbi:helix-turn-helix transcriptional regulator [Paenibacillus sp. LHD-38]|uniref:helix-turn-helix transcriptional regulator n=1 Tax=Paenibacillus sp. LHD-38 TaxID=3072143 RepID=UPI00280D00D8|nr:helix-turn-helix transcriptional regulator [Paenibacillus sp. LHD-38]MDQ8733927.1 helix-turn-helix transcriptional regulator [Paenibacillus sp. LHD-38]
MQVYLTLQPPTLQSELLDSNYQYREFLPSKGLEPYVACYWTVDSYASDNNKLHRIIPDGCVDIIFDLRALSLSKGAIVAGLMTTFETINLTTNYSLFGIRFFSDKVRQFLRYPVSELTGYNVFLEDIWGREAELIVDEVQSANGVSEMMERVELKLLKVLLNNETQSDQLLQSSMHYMIASQGMISIRNLAEKLSYSERNVRRTFQKELGVSPKELLGIIRFQCLLQELNKGTLSHFTDIAVKYGYYDQPHFIHNFKRFYGLTPNQVFN